MPNDKFIFFIFIFFVLLANLALGYWVDDGEWTWNEVTNLVIDKWFFEFNTTWFVEYFPVDETLWFNVPNVNFTGNITVGPGFSFDGCVNELELDVVSLRLPGAGAPSSGFIGISPVLNFDRNINESAYVVRHVPPDYLSGSNYEFEVYWSASDSNGGDVVWCADVRCYDDGDFINGTVMNICVVSSVAGINTVVESPRLVFNGSGADRDYNCGIRIYRGASDSRDTYNADASLVMETVYYNSTCLKGEI